MIIIRFLGGLGNQLFIYAFGRTLELNYGIDVQYDIYTGFKKDSFKRKFELDNFYVKINKATVPDSLYFPFRKRSELITKIFYPASFYIEEDQNFSAEKLIEIEKEYKKVFMQGYFQKAEYFESIREELKKEIVLTKPLSEKANGYLGKVKNSISVAVHIRLKERSNLNQLSFYSESIAKLKKELVNPVFFVFSDDIKYCKENIKFDSEVIFIENTNNQLEDFWLMKNCEHFIIYNSTFSWWASFLATKNDKIIISPFDSYLNDIY